MKQKNKFISTQNINFTYLIWIGTVIQFIFWYHSVTIIEVGQSSRLGFPGWSCLALAVAIFAACVAISVIDHRNRDRISIMQMLGLFLCSIPIYLIVNSSWIRF